MLRFIKILLGRLHLLLLVLLANFAFASDYEITKSRDTVYESPDDIVPGLDIGGGFGWGKKVDDTSSDGEYVEGAWTHAWTDRGLVFVIKLSSPDNKIDEQTVNKDRAWRAIREEKYKKLVNEDQIARNLPTISTCSPVFQVKHDSSKGEPMLYDILVLTSFNGHDSLCKPSDFVDITTTSTDQIFKFYIAIPGELKLTSYGSSYFARLGYGTDYSVNISTQSNVNVCVGDCDEDFLSQITVPTNGNIRQRLEEYYGLVEACGQYNDCDVLNAYRSQDKDNDGIPNYIDQVNYIEPSERNKDTNVNFVADIYETDDEILHRNCVRFYKEPHYRGDSRLFCLNADGSEQYYGYLGRGFADTFSSVKVGASVYVTHYHDNDKKGWAWTRKNNDANFNKGTRNKISSLEVFPRSIDPTCVRFWDRQGHQGQRWDYCLNDVQSPSWAAKDINNKVEGIHVGDYIDVDLWEGFNRDGRHDRYAAGKKLTRLIIDNDYSYAELSPITDAYQFSALEAENLHLFNDAPKGAMFSIEVLLTNGEKKVFYKQLSENDNQHLAHRWPRAIANKINNEGIDGLQAGVIDRNGIVSETVGSDYRNLVIWERDIVQSVRITLLSNDYSGGVASNVGFDDTIHFSPIRLDGTEKNETFTGNEIVITINFVDGSVTSEYINISDYWKESWRWPKMVADVIDGLGIESLEAGKKIGDNEVGYSEASGNTNYLKYDTEAIANVSIMHSPDSTKGTDSCITAYSKPGYRGNSWRFCLGQDISGKGKDWNNNIHSYKVGDDVRFVFHASGSADGTKGPSVKIMRPGTNIKESTWRGNITDVRVIEATLPNCVDTYSGKNFSGDKWTFCEGQDLSGEGQSWNKNISSYLVGKDVIFGIYSDNRSDRMYRDSYITSSSYAGKVNRVRVISYDDHKAERVAAVDSLCVKAYAKRDFTGKSWTFCSYVDLSGKDQDWNKDIESYIVGKKVRFEIDAEGEDETVTMSGNSVVTRTDFSNRITDVKVSVEPSLCFMCF